MFECLIDNDDKQARRCRVFCRKDAKLLNLSARGCPCQIDGAIDGERVVDFRELRCELLLYMLCDYFVCMWDMLGQNSLCNELWDEGCLERVGRAHDSCYDEIDRVGVGNCKKNTERVTRVYGVV